MERIEVTTSHNIVVRFELASVIFRVVAGLIDILILMFFSFLCMATLGANSIVYALLLFPAWAFYHLVFEVFNNGQSLGKKLMKIRVVSLGGRNAKMKDYLTRWAFRFVDVMPSLGMVGIIFISSSEKKQRVGDMLANTTVVKVKNENTVQLSSIEKIDSDKEILYPGIVHFSDKDMLLVKESINRYYNTPNNENMLIIQELTNRITEKLHINPKGLKRIDFLKRALYEYVLLTR